MSCPISGAASRTCSHSRGSEGRPLNRDPAADRLHADLGLKRLNPVWAKLEIVLGLLAAGAGVPLLVVRPDAVAVAGGLALFVLGGYLALAGHRSHLYQ